MISKSLKMTMGALTLGLCPSAFVSARPFQDLPDISGVVSSTDAALPKNVLSLESKAPKKQITRRMKRLIEKIFFDGDKRKRRTETENVQQNYRRADGSPATLFDVYGQLVADNANIDMGEAKELLRTVCNEDYNDSAAMIKSFREHTRRVQISKELDPKNATKWQLGSGITLALTITSAIGMYGNMAVSNAVHKTIFSHCLWIMTLLLLVVGCIAVKKTFGGWSAFGFAVGSFFAGIGTACAIVATTQLHSEIGTDLVKSASSEQFWSFTGLAIFLLVVGSLIAITTTWKCRVRA